MRSIIVVVVMGHSLGQEIAVVTTELVVEAVAEEPIVLERVVVELIVVVEDHVAVKLVETLRLWPMAGCRSCHRTYSRNTL